MKEAKQFLQDPAPEGSVRSGAVELMPAPANMVSGDAKKTAVYDKEMQYVQIYFLKFRVCVNLHLLSQEIKAWYAQNCTVKTFFSGAVKENEYSLIHRLWYDNPVVDATETTEQFQFVLETLLDEKMISQRQYGKLEKCWTSLLEIAERKRKKKKSAARKRKSQS